MKIVVPIKRVTVLDEDFELAQDGLGVDPETADGDLNEWDAFSVEAALTLQDSLGGEVVVVTAGDEDAEEGLLASLAKGADRAVRIWDDSLSGADPLSVAHVLQAWIAREDADLVLCGAQSSDAATGSTGVALAAKLGVPHVAVISKLEAEPGGRSLRVGRELEGGLIEELKVELPALLTVQTGLNEPRYANLRAIKRAREKPLEVLGFTDLGLDQAVVEAAAGFRIRSLSLPPETEGAEMLSGSAAEMAARIAELLRERVPS